MLVDFDLTPHYLHAYINGSFHLAKLKNLLVHIFAEAHTTGAKSLLLDTRNINGPIGTSARYELGELVAHLIFKHFGHFQFKVALVTSEQLMDPDRFATVVAENRGARVYSDTDFDKVCAWLLR